MRVCMWLIWMRIGTRLVQKHCVKAHQVPAIQSICVLYY